MATGGGGKDATPGGNRRGWGSQPVVAPTDFGGGVRRVVSWNPAGLADSFTRYHTQAAPIAESVAPSVDEYLYLLQERNR